jgi:hypothetical protein
MSNAPFGVLDPVKYVVNTLMTQWRFVARGYRDAMLIPLAILSLLWGPPALIYIFSIKSIFSLILGVVAMLVGVIYCLVWLWSLPGALVIVSLDIYEGKDTNLQTIKSASRFTPAIIGADILAWFVQLVVYASLGIVTSLIPLVMIFEGALMGFIVVCVNLFISYRFTFISFCIVDKGCSVTESLKCSYRLTQDKVLLILGSMLCLALSCLLLLMLSIVCVGALFAISNITGYIGAVVAGVAFGLYSISAVYLANAYMYRKLIEHPESTEHQAEVATDVSL